ncbi:MAG: Bug family tripartite tricarboxylate transporter substrate binding protein [Xanthobacteraceae bacterium]
MMDRRRLIISAASVLAPALIARVAPAQEWPSRPVRLVVPYPAGGGADAIARIVSGRLADMWRQQVVIENRGGAGGNIASEAVARSVPDGYTLYLAGEFQATNSYLYPKLTYDPVADFLPVSLVVKYPIAVVVPNASPARSLPEFIAHAKANPGRLTMASPGHGTGPHLAGEMFKRVAGIELTHVPYRGAAPALQDVVPGRVDSFFNNIAGVAPLMREGQLKVLAITSAERIPAEPQLPTVAESGLAGFDVSGWYAFFVPAMTPPAIVRRMHADTAAALAEPSIKGRLEQLGLVVVGSTPEDLGAHLKAEMAKWGPLIKGAGLKLGE